MRIVEFQAENIKKIKAIQIKPDGNFVEITGANRQGKSSILDAIWFALGGTKTHQSEVIRSGEDKAHVFLNLGDIIVRREFHRRVVEKGEGEEKPEETRVTTSLAVETKDGAKYSSPQRMLDKLVGSISFDPLKFARMEPRAQYDILRRMSGIDNDALEQENKADYAERTLKNREARGLRSRVEAIEVPEDTPDDEVSVASIVKRLEEAQDHNERIDIAEAAREERRKNLRVLEVEVEGYEQEIVKLQALIVARQKAMTTLETKISKERSLSERVDVSVIHAELGGVEKRNAAVRFKLERAKLQVEAKAAEDEVEAYNNAMQGRADQMRRNIEEADMPVEGLCLSDGLVKYRESEEADAHVFEVLSDAEQLRISCAIAIREHPKLRVIRIRDGSLLDELSLQALKNMAVQEDYQIWIERVDTSGKIGIVIEDGMVKNAEGESAASVAAMQA